MKIFWVDGEGNAPPENAVFGCCPFSSNFPSPSFSAVTRIQQLPLLTQPIRVLRRTFLPSQEQWSSLIHDTTHAIEKKAFNKVVLARCCVLECERPPDPFAVTASLLAKAKNSTVFCYAFENKAFLGASPELLFSRNGLEIQTEAVAGTCRRGDTTEEDIALEEELLKNKKAASEIHPVMTHLQNSLFSYCTSPLSFSPFHVRKTSNVQHLSAQAHGKLRASISDAQLIQSIHPTPALCGTPTQNAFDWIKNKEPFQRGLYGGALGWQTPEKSVWVVAIRCCFIEDTIVKLYTGAGIVAGSNPQDEWEELNHKMSLYKDIFI